MKMIKTQISQLKFECLFTLHSIFLSKSVAVFVNEHKYFFQDKEQLPLHMASSRTGNNAVSITQAVLRATNRNLRLNPDKVRILSLLDCFTIDEPNAVLTLFDEA